MAVIQSSTFRLLAGADEAAFVAADATFQTTVAYHHRGLVRRTLARGGGGEWLVLTIWYSATDADAAPAPSDELLAMIATETLQERRYETLPG